MILSACRKLFCLSAGKSLLHPPCFSGDIAKICKLIFGTLGMPSYTHPKLQQKLISTANKYYSSASQHEQKNKKATSQIKFPAVTKKTTNKTSLTTSLCKNEFNVLFQVLPLHSFFYSISCLVK